MNEEELIQLLINNPQEGLREAINEYGTTVHWIITKILGATYREDIEECVSDVFARLWKSIENFDKDKETKLSSYVYGIARHTALDYLRKRNKVDIIPFEENDLQIEVDYTDEFAKKKNAQIIQSTIDQLPQPDRDIFIYRYYFKFKITEISKRLGLKPKQVENKLYRGKEIVKKNLMEKGIIL